MSWKNMPHQIEITGAMGAIMQDNGGEFNCEEMQKVAYGLYICRRKSIS